MHDDVACVAKNNSVGSDILHRLTLILFLIFAAISVMAPTSASAQVYSFQSVSVDGNQRIETQSILRYAEISRGRSISASDLNAAYQRVVDTGLFDTVEFIPQGRRLLIRVIENPTINVISIEGNKRIDDDAAREIITSQPRRVYSAIQAERDATALAQAYQAQGRLAAAVTPKIIRRSDNRVDLVFEVREGRGSEIERLSIVGNRVFSDRRLRRVMGTKQAGLLRQIIKQDTYVADRIAFDKQLLSDFYQARGYVDFQVLSVTSEFSRERNAFFVTFNVREGQKFNIGDVTTVSEIADADADEFGREVRVRSGQTYTPQSVDNSIARLERLALRKGLSLLRVEPRVTRNDRDLTLDIEFALVRGPRVFVERIDIEGNVTTLDKVIRRQFRTVEGDTFNPREIREAADRIRDLGLFTSSNVQARGGTDEDQVIVDVEVEEGLTGSLGFGMSYDTSGGVGVTANFSEKNLLGRGQTLNLDINAGLDNTSGGITFIEPYFMGRNLKFSFTGQFRQTEYDYTDYDTQSILFRPGFEFPVSENGRLGVNFTLSKDKIFNVDAGSSVVLMNEAASGDVFGTSVGYSYSYDTRRGGLSPTSGLLLRFGQDFGSQDNGGSFIKTTATASYHKQILNEEVTLTATFEGGALLRSGGDSRLTERFFLSSNQMRGFAPAGLGPRDLGAANEDALGGNYFAVARFEADFPLGLPEEYGIMGGVFLDVGTVWGLDDTLGGAIDDSLHIRSSAGVSIFWTTPIGPLRFNFSRAINKESYDETQNFNLTVSTRF
ncbi:MAG: outer membrane protein assembly factor BamA [Marinosulfonomonas sp.]|nr:outer membrane protein assembly factor BamA [Marinosulfonomonas sp.]